MISILKKLLVTAMLALSVTACTSVESGHVGVRVWTNGSIDEREIPPGFAQVFIGDVRHYVANDITWSLKNLRPQTKDKTKLQDLDLTYTYSVEPSKIVDSVLKYKGRDAVDPSGVYYPLARYVENIMTDSTTDVFVKYDALDANQNREKIKAEILETARAKFKAEGFDGIIRVQQIFIKNLDLDASIVKSATNVINAQNVLTAKEYEVQTARKEAERLTVLASNAKNIDYLKVEIQRDFVAALAKNNNATYVIPSDLTSFMINK